MTVTGTNDVVSITSGVQNGAIVEETSLDAAGTISFTDVDLSDGHTASFSATPGETALGTFALDPVSEAANAANGTVQWHYTLNNAAAQSLAAGQSVVEHYTVTVNDGHGSTAAQTVTVTITGTNDVVSITGGVQNGAIVEETSLDAAGTISFTDVDLSDGHTASFSATPGETALGTFALDPVSEVANAANGTVQWHYILNNAAAQSLAAGQSVVEHYTVTVNDGHGSTTAQTVTVTVTGTNDTATIAASATEDTAVEEDGGTANGTAGDPSASGQLTVHDVDSGEDHFQTPAAAALAGAYGSFTFNQTSGAWTYTLNQALADLLTDGQIVHEHLVVTSVDGTASHDITVTLTGTNDTATITASATEDTVGDPSASGQLTVHDVDSGEDHFQTPAAAALAGAYGGFTFNQTSGAWTYTFNQALADQLTDGQIVHEHLFVTSVDGTANYDINVTVTGTNDAPTISGFSGNGAVTEDGDGDDADILPDATQAAAGTIDFVNVDLADAHTVSATPANSGYLGTFTPSIADASTGDGAGLVIWNFTVGNAALQFLAEGEQLTQTYTVTVDDGHGGTASHDVTITRHRHQRRAGGGRRHQCRRSKTAPSPARSPPTTAMSTTATPRR